jgi:hypothetical protein
VVKNNIIWGDFKNSTEATVTGNAMKTEVPGNRNDVPSMVKDGFVLMPDAVFPHKLGITTELFDSKGSFIENEFVNRVIRAGDRWGIVKSNSKNMIEIWGDLSGEVLFSVMPSYQLR